MVIYMWSHACDVSIQEGGKAETEGGVARGEGGGLKRLLEGLPELWSEQQYADEYDLSGFIGSLSSCQ